MNLYLTKPEWLLLFLVGLSIVLAWDNRYHEHIWAEEE